MQSGNKDQVCRLEFPGKKENILGYIASWEDSFADVSQYAIRRDRRETSNI